MNKKMILCSIEKEAKKYFKNAEPTHDWSHVQRVLSLAVRLGKRENADIFVIHGEQTTIFR